jgi:DNA-binding transcriptional regulator LsrR (DeoR family)
LDLGVGKMLTAADVVEIRRQFHEDGAWQADIARRFGVSVATVSRCIHHRVFGV